jgi:hypothetical protein
MSLKPRLQIGILDILLLTTLVAGIVAAIGTDQPPIAFITSSCLGLFIWHRPVVATLWVIGMIGLGSGLFCAGWQGNHTLHMPTGEVMGWGAGMVVGGFTYLFATARLRQQLKEEQTTTPAG